MQISGYKSEHERPNLKSSHNFWSVFFLFDGGLQRDVVYLGWPIAPSYMSPNAGGGGVAGSQPMSTEAEFLDEIQTKVLNVFLLVIHSHIYSFDLIYLFRQTHATCYSFCKRETLQKTIPQVWEPKDYAQKPQWNCTFMSSALAEHRGQ
jgi:hypothetical protein